MNLRTDFIKQYTALPDRRGLRNIVLGMWVAVSAINLMVSHVLENELLKHACWTVILIYDVCGLIFMLFPKKLTKYIFLYTAVGFAGTSIHLLYCANVIAFKELKWNGGIFTFISIIAYSLVIVAMVKNISNKMRKGVSHVIHNQGAFTMAALGGIIGKRLADVNLFRGNLPLAVDALLIACCFALPCSGFHKFYLINKMIKEGLEIKDFVQKNDKLKQKEKNS